MNHPSYRRYVVAVLCLAFLAGCGGRVPTPKKAQHLVQKHFKKYGKKYRESDFGRHPVEKVEISSVNPLQKNLADAEAYTILSGEGGAYKVRVTFQKKTLGWRVLNWESLVQASLNQAGP